MKKFASIIAFFVIMFVVCNIAMAKKVTVVYEFPYLFPGIAVEINDDKPAKEEDPLNEFGCKDAYFDSVLKDFRSRCLPDGSDIEEYNKTCNPSMKKNICFIFHRNSNGQIIEGEFFLLTTEEIQFAKRCVPEDWMVYKLDEIPEEMKGEVLDYYVMYLQYNYLYRPEAPGRRMEITKKNTVGRNETITIYCNDTELWILKKLLKSCKK